MSKDTGGSAFPRSGFLAPNGEVTEYTEPYSGMTLRDWFAGRAMAALAGILFEEARKDGRGAGETAQVLCEAAYRTADAMIAERNKP
jgi:hypothetical protein